MASSKICRCKRGSGTESRRDGLRAVPCPCRAVFRNAVNNKLLSRRLNALSDNLYPPELIAEDQRLLRAFPTTLKIRDLVEDIDAKDGEEIESLCNRLSFPESAAEANAAIAKLVESLLKNTRWGRILTLITFSACVACRCADHGHEYVRTLLDQLENNVDEKLHEWIERTEQQEAVTLCAAREHDWRPAAPSFRTLGFAALAVVGLAVVTVGVPSSS